MYPMKFYWNLENVLIVMQYFEIPCKKPAKWVTGSNVLEYSSECGKCLFFRFCLEKVDFVK